MNNKEEYMLEIEIKNAKIESTRHAERESGPMKKLKPPQRLRLAQETNKRGLYLYEVLEGIIEKYLAGTAPDVASAFAGEAIELEE